MKSDDLISRQAAIDLWDKYHPYIATKAMAYDRELRALPSAQTEIIYCGDCRYKDDGIDEDGIPFLKCLHSRSYGNTRINDFCSWGKRRTDG